MLLHKYISGVCSIISSFSDANEKQNIKKFVLGLNKIIFEQWYLVDNT